MIREKIAAKRPQEYGHRSRMRPAIFKSIVNELLSQKVGRLPPSGLPGLRLKLPTIARHRKAERKIDQADENIDLDAEGLPGGIDDRGFRRRQQVEDADD